MNSAFWSTNFSMSQGQATRSTLGCSRVIHFIVFSSSPLTAVYDVGCRTPSDILQRRGRAVDRRLVTDRDRTHSGVLLGHAERFPEAGLVGHAEEDGPEPCVDGGLQDQ